MGRPFGSAQGGGRSPRPTDQRPPIKKRILEMDVDIVDIVDLTINRFVDIVEIKVSEFYGNVRVIY